MSSLFDNMRDVLNSHIREILLDIAENHDINSQKLLDKYLLQPLTDQAPHINADVGDKNTETKEKKKRGRKKKQKDEFIETEEYEYEGEKYLVDGNNNVYTYNIQEPMMIGERLVDGTIKIFDSLKV